MGDIGVSFEFTVHIEERDGYFRATVEQFPGFAYGDTKIEAEENAVKGLYSLLEYHKEAPRTIEAYLSHRDVDFEVGYVEGTSLTRISEQTTQKMHTTKEHVNA